MMDYVGDEQELVDRQCFCPEHTGPSEPIPPEGLVELHPYGCVVCWNADGSIAFVMHPDAYVDMMNGDTGGVDVLKGKSWEPTQ